MSRLEQAQALYTWLTGQVRYDFRYYGQPGEMPYDSTTAYGALHDHLAICGGYAQALQLLLTQANIPCITVSGKLGGENHMWALAKVDGQWRYFDPTSDRGRRSTGSSISTPGGGPGAPHLGRGLGANAGRGALPLTALRPAGLSDSRRAQENAEVRKRAGHFVSGPRSRSAVYLPSCLAISSAKFAPARLWPGGDPGSHSSRGKVNPPRRKVLPPAKPCTRHPARPAFGGRRRTPKCGKGPDTLCPAPVHALRFTCPAAWRSPRRSSPPPGSGRAGTPDLIPVGAK